MAFKGPFQSKLFYDSMIPSCYVCSNLSAEEICSPWLCSYLASTGCSPRWVQASLSSMWSFFCQCQGICPRSLYWHQCQILFEVSLFLQIALLALRNEAVKKVKGNARPSLLLRKSSEVIPSVPLVVLQWCLYSLWKM